MAIEFRDDKKSKYRGWIECFTSTLPSEESIRAKEIACIPSVVELKTRIDSSAKSDDDSDPRSQ